MELTPRPQDWAALYKLMIGSILPRPIGWISSVDAQGTPNLAPYSFFNAVCANPPTVLFCPMIRGMAGNHKDTLRNVRETGEFVVNIVSAPLAEAMNATAADFPPEVDEFEAVGLAKAPSVVVRPPRVAASLIHYECKVSQIVTVGEAAGGGSVVLGEVVHLHVDDKVLIGTDKIDLAVLQPIGRLAGSAYTHVTVESLFEMRRPSA
ncbi:MAG: flavin reductase family protein [Chloroflexi bacterium CFX4]|nr:flavin reductase family protein [Chloroflexi bacterium CFX4]MDL1922791.1 flavin reductase family protein [Chloroflexi bacterium CFX3]